MIRSTATNITTAPIRRRQTPKWVRNIIILILSPFIAALLMGATVGLYQAVTQGKVTSTPAKIDKVATFNDGFADSKQDDCQQGFQKACDWLASR
jgi:hypothetical protein